MLGLCLPGGGAKGAFSAGVVYGLYEKGIMFDAISGTSIGAINSYFIYSKNIEKLKEIWTSIDKEEFKREKCTKNVIENSKLIDILDGIEGRDENIKNFYVNYINVENSDLKEIILDICNLDRKDILNYIKYSSLLPYRSDKEIFMEEILNNFDSKKVFDQFKEDIGNGIYDGYNLDGGILNNNLLNPFMENKVDKLFIAPLKKNYVVPEYILDKYSIKDIVIIEPSTDMEPNDTLRFEKEFCCKLFYEGYEKAININLKEVLKYEKSSI